MFEKYLKTVDLSGFPEEARPAVVKLLEDAWADAHGVAIGRVVTVIFGMRRRLRSEGRPGDAAILGKAAVEVAGIEA